VRQGIGAIDQFLSGAATVTMTFQINNSDPDFDSGSPATNAMKQAWGANFGKPILLPSGTPVKLRQTVLAISSLGTHVGSVNSSGGAKITVAKNGNTNTCVTMQRSSMRIPC
jgi:hypothetical protein